MSERRSSFCYSRGLAACCCIGGQRRHHFDRQPRRRQVDPLVRSLATYDRSDRLDPLATPSRKDCYLRKRDALIRPESTFSGPSGPRLRTPQLGAERAYRGRLGKDQSSARSGPCRRHAAASLARLLPQCFIRTRSMHRRTRNCCPTRYACRPDSSHRNSSCRHRGAGTP
jgi:hypothetical protein